MIFKNIFILLFSVNYLEIIFGENVVRPIFQFILANEALCGDLFVDPEWLPALEYCQIDCDISSQICQERNDTKIFPGQRCMNLPLLCKDRIKHMLNLDPDIPALQLPLAPLTTLAPTTPSIHEQDVEVNEDNQMPSMEPQMPVAVPFDATPPPSFPQNNLLQPPITKNFRDPQYSLPAAPAYEPMPPSYNSIYEPITTTPSPFYTAPPDVEEYNPIRVTTMSPDYEDERNVEPESKQPSSNWGRETIGNNGYRNRNGGYFEKPKNNEIYDDYDTTLQPSYRMSMMGPTMSQPKSPWSWIDLEKKLQHRPFYSVDQSGSIEDFSPNCCQWALDGLCDRSWQRVRQLCQKSCGTVVCTSIEGGLSCNRAIDVNVLDCFQRRKFYMLHAAPMNYQPGNYRNRPRHPPLNNRKTAIQEEKNSAFSRAYAIENEIKGFNSGFK